MILIYDLVENSWVVSRIIVGQRRLQYGYSCNISYTVWFCLLWTMMCGRTLLNRTTTTDHIAKTLSCGAKRAKNVDLLGLSRNDTVHLLD